MKNLNLEIPEKLKKVMLLMVMSLLYHLFKMIELGFAKKQSRICYKICTL